MYKPTEPGPDRTYRDVVKRAHNRVQTIDGHQPDYPKYWDSWDAAMAIEYEALGPHEKAPFFRGQRLYTQQLEEAKLHSNRKVEYYEQGTNDDLTGLPMRSVIRGFLTEKLRDRRDETRLEKEILETDQSLTSLANRLLERREPQKRTFSVLMLDLRGFKKINDNYNHLVGDEALKEVARRLKESVRGVDLVARWGGDEFLIVLTGADAAAHEKIREKLREIFANTWVYAPDHGKDIQISTGIGIVEAQEGDTPEIIQKRADLALARNKEDGPSREDFVLTTRPHKEEAQPAPEIIYAPSYPEPLSIPTIT